MYSRWKLHCWLSLLPVSPLHSIQFGFLDVSVNWIISCSGQSVSCTSFTSYKVYYHYAFVSVIWIIPCSEWFYLVKVCKGLAFNCSRVNYSWFHSLSRMWSTCSPCSSRRRASEMAAKHSSNRCELCRRKGTGKILFFHKYAINSRRNLGIYWQMLICLGRVLIAIGLPRDC